MTIQLAPSLADQLLAGRDRFLAFVRARIADPHLAEDIVQDALLRALRAAPELEDESRLTTWFYRVLQNAIVDAYRRRAVDRGRHAGPEALGESEPAAPPLTPGVEAALCECFRPLIATLNADYAAVLTALDLDGEPPAAAAARLGITPNNLKVRRHRARQALRKRLEETCRLCAEHHCLDCTCPSSSRGAALPGV